MSPDEASAYFAKVAQRAAGAGKFGTAVLQDATTALAAQVRARAGQQGMRAAVTTTTGAERATVTVRVPPGRGPQAQALVAAAVRQVQTSLPAQAHAAAAAEARSIVAP